MKKTYYPKLAADGIRKNRRLYLPYILTCIGMVMMYYIISFLHYSPTIAKLRGGATICVMMDFGSWIIAVFACIFLFYTNSFLIRRRKKEFGLYNILGMGKRHISLTLFYETLIIWAIALVCGLFLGILLSKIAELGLVFLMQGTVEYTLYISFQTIIMTVAVFAAIFLLLFFNAVRQIRFTNTVVLIKGENVGEKPPRANWFCGVLGVILLGAAYYLAVSIQNPLQAILWFFVAVVMVIIATYLLMISGSVLLCRILQKSKSYYYRPNHFVSVSSMVYRMKRNGAGLASICILATMVLVTISSTSCLYFGKEDSLRSQYPRQICMQIYYRDPADFTNETREPMRAALRRYLQEKQVQTSNLYDLPYANVTGVMLDGVIECDPHQVTGFDYKDLCNYYFINAADYARLSGERIDLQDGEAVLLTNDTVYTASALRFTNGTDLTVKWSRKDDFAEQIDRMNGLVHNIYVVVQDVPAALAAFTNRETGNFFDQVTLYWDYFFDTDQEESVQQEIATALLSVIFPPHDSMNVYITSRAAASSEFYGSYGGLFYLGILLSLVFITAAVLIIYYKQVSEGYEDQSRFAIMQKVGMTKKEIRRSINSQLLTVFFLPLFLAGLHLIFAFPMIRKLLMLFALNNLGLFLISNGISFALFVLFYTVVYRLTSNAYYAIVSQIA